MPKKFRPAGDCWHLKVSTLKVKYVKRVLWGVAKCLSYIEEARCLKVKQAAEHLELELFHVKTSTILLLYG